MKPSSFLLILLLAISLQACQSEQNTASSTSIVNQSIEAIHQKELSHLPFDDLSDFKNAKRGFIATRQDRIIKANNGRTAMDIQEYDFMQTDAPASANPSLWRQGQLNSLHGLFKVTEGIYQVRGFDLANMSLIATDSGWIIVDPLTTVEAANAAIELVDQQLGQKPIKAVVITHSHIDHFGGIKGVISQQEVDAGQVEIIAPEGFYESAVSENIIAGNAMRRRATYMFGTLLPTDTIGSVGVGLGQAVSVGTNTILKPTITISETGQRVTIDGIEMIFQNTPGAEAPAECMFYFPQYKAFCQAEEINHTLHNMYTLRGAEVRNGLIWSKYIDESIQLFGEDVDISFGSHHWPTWGNDTILDFWSKQRDLYKFIHDETLYLANKGHNATEIAEMIELPESLSSAFANRGYYGTVSHNAKAQYQLYYGWFDGNPANLNPLPPTAEAIKYIEYMGGAKAVIKKVKKDIDKGAYRWAATVLNHLVFMDSSNQEARLLLADVYKQLGYTTESGPWRNFYLTGAQELEEGITLKHMKNASDQSEIIENLSLEKFYDYMAVRLDRSMTSGKEYHFNMIFPDSKEKISLHLVNDVLHNRVGVLANNPNATITMNRSIFNQIITKKTTGMDMIKSGDIKIEGDGAAYADFQKIVGTPFEVMFNIVEP